MPCRLAEEVGDGLGVERAYVNFTDTLMKLGGPESRRGWGKRDRADPSLGDPRLAAGVEPDRGVAAIGEWDAAPDGSCRRFADRQRSFHGWLVIRAAVESPWRARGRAGARRGREPPRTKTTSLGLLRLHTWQSSPCGSTVGDDADATIRKGVAHARGREGAAQMRVRCVPRDCARRQSSRRWPARGATRMACATDSDGTRDLLVAPPSGSGGLGGLLGFRRLARARRSRTRASGGCRATRSMDGGSGSLGAA